MALSDAAFSEGLFTSEFRRATSRNASGIRHRPGTVRGHLYRPADFLVLGGSRVRQSGKLKTRKSLNLSRPDCRVAQRFWLIFYLRHSSAMLSSPRRPSSTIRIFSSAVLNTGFDCPKGSDDVRLLHHYCFSISLSLNVFSKKACSGPYRRKIGKKLLPPVGIQFDSSPAGAVLPK